MPSLAEAATARRDRLVTSEIDKRVDLLLANLVGGENPGDRYHAVTANPRSMGYLRFLLRHYAKSPTPWRDCFPPDTPIDCPRDHERFPNGVPISQLKSGDLVWSFNSDLHVFELKPVSWSSPIRRDAQLAMLTLDDGAQIKATPDHKFMRRDGSWAELQDLRPGDSLMPFYRDYLPMVRLSPDRVQWVTEHEQVAQTQGEDRKGKHVHHVDERRVNTDPHNLALLTSSAHARLHHETARQQLAARGEMRRCRYCENVFTPQYRNHLTCGQCPESAGRVRQIVGTTRTCHACETDFVANSPTHRFCSPTCRGDSYIRANERRYQDCAACGEKYRTRRGNSRFCITCSPPKRSATERPMVEARICRNCGDEFKPASGIQRHCSATCRREFSSRSYTERNPGMAPTFNHKVASVVVLDEYQDVWDIEVADNHSFVVHGVVAHNCFKDNFKRFGAKAKGLCGVLKDTLRQHADWRGHPSRDVGAPGVAIGEGDKWASPAWGGHGLSERPLSLLDELDLEFGVVDHTESLSEAAQVLIALGEKCDVYRVLIGLDEPPAINLSEVLA